MPSIVISRKAGKAILRSLRFPRRLCDHDWQYDEVESAGPWTGYIERCSKCGAVQQIPQ